MIVWRSTTVRMGTAAHRAMRRAADEAAARLGGQGEWWDEYSDTTARGVFVVRKG